MLNKAFTGFQEYDYFRADTLTEEEARQFYKKRTENLKAWLAEEGGGANQFENEKEFLVNQYEFGTPWYYESSDGFDAWFTYSNDLYAGGSYGEFPGIGIFPAKRDIVRLPVYFASMGGKAVLAKIKAGVLTATFVYWGIMLLSSRSCIGVSGTAGRINV